MDKVGRIKFTTKEKANILKKTNGLCAHCGKKLDEYTMTVEHIYPIAKGGDHSEFNLVALCEKCNYEKSNDVCEIRGYYKYILEKYIYKYGHQLNKFMMYCDNDNIIKYSYLTYRVIPDNLKGVLNKPGKRSDRALKAICKNCCVKLKLEKAYSGDTEKIIAFLDKKASKYAIKSLPLYDNIYKILNAIQFGEVYTLTSPNGELHGVIILDKISIEDIDNPAIINIYEEIGCSSIYIMKLAFIDDKMEQVFSEIMDDFKHNCIIQKKLLLYFNVLDICYHGKDEYIKIPYTIDNVDGQLEWFSIKSIRKYCIEKYSDLKKYGVTQDEIDKLVDFITRGLTDEEMSEYLEYYNYLDKKILGDRRVDDE